MSAFPEEEYRLIGDIYDAAVNPALWLSVIPQIADFARAEKANVLAFDKLNPDYFLFHSHGTTTEMLQHYQDGGFAELDMEFSVKWLGATGIGSVSANHQHFGDIENYKRAAGSLYKYFFSKIGIEYQCGGILDKTDFRWSSLGLHRSKKCSPFEDETVAAITRLMPHLRRSLQIYRQLSLVQQHNARLYRMLDVLVAGVLMLDANGRVRYANPSAERLLRNHDALQLNLKGTLKAAHTIQQTPLQDLIQGAIAVSQRDRAAIPSGGVIGLKNAAGETPLMLTITPLSELSGYEDLGSDGIAAAIFLTNPNANHVLARQLLKQSYALSERESELCEAFVNHATLEGVAEACGLSLATVRTYIKSIYEKTGQHSQAALMRLLMGLRVDFEHIR